MTPREPRVAFDDSGNLVRATGQPAPLPRMPPGVHPAIARLARAGWHCAHCGDTTADLLHLFLRAAVCSACLPTLRTHRLRRWGQREGEQLRAPTTPNWDIRRRWLFGIVADTLNNAPRTTHQHVAALLEGPR